MPTYKQRRIDLDPICQADGTWQCSYTIIEFRQTCWGCQDGHLDGTYSTRDNDHEELLIAQSLHGGPSFQGGVEE
ncbi:MAG: hypothetical protein H8K04_02965 [Nitrospira sp.]